MFFKTVFLLQDQSPNLHIYGALNTTSGAQNTHSDTKDNFSRSFHRINFKVVYEYVMLTIAINISNNIDLIFYSCVVARYW